MRRTVLALALFAIAAPAWAGQAPAKDWPENMTRKDCYRYLSHVRQQMREAVEAGGNVGNSFTAPIEFCTTTYGFKPEQFKG